MNVDDLGFPWRIDRAVLNDADECGGERVIEKALIAADGAVVADFSLSAKWFADYVVSKLNGEFMIDQEIASRFLGLTNEPSGDTIPLSQLQQNVTEWSRDNFGDQKGINHLAPLIGIGEEIGELVHAEVGKQSDCEIKDAVADIFIYFMDLCSRLGYDLASEGSLPDTAVKLDSEDPVEIQRQSVQLLTAVYGQLCHACLKRHQGIRGYDNDQYFRERINDVFDRLFATISVVAFAYGFRLEEIATETWNNIVSKRNWKKPLGAVCPVVVLPHHASGNDGIHTDAVEPQSTEENCGDVREN